MFGLQTSNTSPTDPAIGAVGVQVSRKTCHSPVAPLPLAVLPLLLPFVVYVCVIKNRMMCERKKGVRRRFVMSLSLGPIRSSLNRIFDAPGTPSCGLFLLFPVLGALSASLLGTRVHRRVHAPRPSSVAFRRLWRFGRHLGVEVVVELVVEMVRCR